MTHKPNGSRRATLLRTAGLAGLAYAFGMALALFAPAPESTAETQELPTQALAARAVASSVLTTDEAATGGGAAFEPDRAAPSRAVRAAPTRRRRVRSEDQATERTLPAPEHHPRPESEWQGMLVDVSTQSSCESIDGCGLAMACLDGGQCGPCGEDSDCASGEACVLDHCVVESRVECHRTSQCGDDEVCMLSGYSAGVRGNEDMSAVCSPSHGEAESPEMMEMLQLAAAEPAEAAEHEPRPVSVSDLRDSLIP